MSILPADLHQYEIGDVLDVSLQGAGKAMKYRHPAVLIGSDWPTDYATVIPLTSRDYWTAFPLTWQVKKNTANGLDKNSYALVFQVTVLDPKFILGKRGRLDPDDLAQIKTLLKIHFQLP